MARFVLGVIAVVGLVCAVTAVWTDAALAAKAPDAKQPAALQWGPWYQIGPFYPKEGRGFSTVFPPEQGVDVAKPCGDLKWAPHPEYADGAVQALVANANGSTYLYRKITAGQATTVTAYIGSDDGLVVWLNGKKLHEADTARGAGPSDRVDLSLVPGDNHLLLKIYNKSGQHGFYFSTSAKPAAPAAKAARPAASAKAAAASAPAAPTGPNFDALERAVTDLVETYGDKYPRGKEYLARLAALQKAYEAAQPAAGGAGAAASGQRAAAPAPASPEIMKQWTDLQREALLANPLLAFGRLLLVKRAAVGKLGLPNNWLGNCSIASRGYDNEIAVLSPIRPDGALKTLYKPEGSDFVGDIELHWDAGRLLFSKPGTLDRWQVFEIKTDGTGLRQVTPGDQPDVDNYDACYLPDGRIIFCSTACYLGVPCVGGSAPVGSLYLLDPARETIRQLTFDQDHSWCPTVLNNGRVLYTRWEYSDTPHYFSRLLFEMNPDGTSQFEYYGSNSYWPNSTFYARPVPGHPSKVAAIISGHHGVPRMGELVVFDPSQGRHEASGAVQRIPGYGKPVPPTIADGLVNSTWPKFLHPWPLSEKYFLVSCQMSAAAPWALYLVDIFDNMVLVREEPGYALFEPTPLQARPTPPVIPDRVRPDTKTATVYLADVYQGKGLAGVPRGTVKKLRVYTDHFAYRGMGGHINIGIDGPWDAKRILGTVPVNEDGSALFRVPANMPIVVEPLDAQGRALQVMRSWYTAMPGEFASCVGCHEPMSAAPPSRLASATTREPCDIEPWYGPARPFGFEREVQPVLDKYCVSCHDGQARPGGGAPAGRGGPRPDFRAKAKVQDYKGKFTPAYEALHRYVRRPGPESDYHLRPPTEYLADTSELIQMLKKGHHGVALDAEGWDRLYTWIDMNVPCHGTWSEYRAIAANNHERRLVLSKLYGGPEHDPEAYPAMPAVQVTPVAPAREPPPPAQTVRCPGWPFDGAEAQRRQAAAGPVSRAVDLGNGVKLDLALVPAGEFVMGDPAGFNDERPAARVAITRPFWMGKFEIANEQYALFDPRHESGYISVYNKDQSTRGEIAGNPRQPVIRVTWNDAMAFCRWLSEKTGERFTLPTEAQWEYACRAGTATPLFYGACDADFSKFANLADQRVLNLCRRDSPKWIPCVATVSDGSIVDDNVGKYTPNAWGLYDMHGNVCEWTRSAYRPYPYAAGDGRETPAGNEPRAVRGGSWYDRPQRARSAFRLGFEPWRPVYNVGFRVVSETEAPKVVATAAAAE
jgi:formylglycine-generating enzyme required for sulfatase activity